MSLVRQNFHTECENALNQQINMELSASCMYLMMALHFLRDDVALPGVSDYFKKASDEEREHAIELMTYQNKRGGNIMLQNINCPEKTDWGTANEAMREALALEQDVHKSLLEMIGLASHHEDPHLQDLLVKFVQESIDSAHEIASHITKLNMAGDGVGVLIFDNQLKNCK